MHRVILDLAKRRGKYSMKINKNGNNSYSMRCKSYSLLKDTCMHLTEHYVKLFKSMNTFNQPN